MVLAYTNRSTSAAEAARSTFLAPSTLTRWKVSPPLSRTTATRCITAPTPSQARARDYRVQDVALDRLDAIGQPAFRHVPVHQGAHRQVGVRQGGDRTAPDEAGAARYEDSLVEHNAASRGMCRKLMVVTLSMIQPAAVSGRDGESPIKGRSGDGRR